jgi:hypothetical protein
VFVLTAKDLTESEIEMLRRDAIGFLQKSDEWRKQLLAGLRHAVSARAARA